MWFKSWRNENLSSENIVNKKRNKEERNWIIFNSLDNLYIFLFSILFLNNNHLGFCDLKLNFFFYLITNINPSSPNENDILLNFSIFREVGILMFLWLSKNFPVGPKVSYQTLYLRLAFIVCFLTEFFCLAMNV